jgi:polyhydroxyalkanoate synthesis regulator phasin
LDAVNSKLADSAKTIWAENGQKDNNAIAKYIYNNLKQLISKNKPVAGAPGRKDMPQTDVDGDATGKLGLLQKGMINFKDPKSSDIKNDQSVKEMKRLQQLAGILNEEYKKKLEEIVLEGEDKNLVTDPRILALAAKITKQSVDKVEDKVDAVLTGKEEENKEEIKEALAITLALALPMILEAGGSLAGWINKKYGLSKEELVEYKKWQSEYNKLKKTVDSYSDSIKLTDPKTKRYVDNKKAELAKMKQEGSEKFGGKISKFLKEAGHGLHSLYTSPIRALLWTISLFTPEGSDLRNPKIREKIANIIYAVGMIGFAGYGVYHSVQHLVGVSEAATAILDGVKGGKSASEIVKDIPAVAKAFAT